MRTAGRRQKTAKLRQRPHCVGEIWKRSPVSTVRPTVHTNPSRKRSFSKRFTNQMDLKMRAFRFRGDRKYFGNGVFRKDGVRKIMWYSWLSFPQTQIQNCCVFNFSGIVWKENIWYAFRVKPPFSNSYSVCTLIDPIHKWLPIKILFTLTIKISPTNLVFELIIQKNFYSQTSLVGLI